MNLFMGSGYELAIKKIELWKRSRWMSQDSLDISATKETLAVPLEWLKISFRKSSSETGPDL